MESLNDRLARMLTENEPEELRSSYLALPAHGAHIAGSAARRIGANEYRELANSGLAIPADASLAAPIDYVSVYVTVNQYVDYDPNGGLDDLISVLGRNQTRETLLLNLALLNTIAADSNKLAEFESAFCELLAPPLGTRLKNLLYRGAEAGKHRLLARQPILAAIRYVLRNDIGGRDETGDVGTLIAAAMFSQAVAVNLAAERDSSEQIVGISVPMFFELMRSSLLYQADDMWSSIDRVVRLWRTFGDRIATFPLRMSPADLLRQISGLEIEELLGLAFLLYAHATQWEPGARPVVDSDMNSDMDPEKLQAFRALVASDAEGLRSAFAARTSSTFDFLPIQERPVLLTDAGLLVLDLGYLWDRVTSGLYWIVHDHEKQRSERDRQRWSQAYAESVELMVEAQLQQMAPPVLGPGPGSTFYTEEDLERAYGETRRCDAVIDFGADILVVEVVSGQLHVRTRIEGDLSQFKKDTERLILDKCEQLDAACRAILGDPAALLGYQSATAIRLVPVVLVGGGYPINPFTMAYIRDSLDAEEWLSDARVAELCIIDVSELEILEGLAQLGETPNGVLRAWKASGIANVSLRNFVLRTRGGGRELRPHRMDAAVNSTFEKVLDLLRLRGDPAPTAEEEL